jgi:pullulanase
MKSKTLFLFLILVLFGCPAPNSGGGNGGSTDDTLRVHYKRHADDYTGWGLHLWVAGGDGLTTWDTPLLFSQTDSFGRYADVIDPEALVGLNFIVHLGDTKDITSDRSIPVGVDEVWLIEGVATVFTEEPNFLPLQAEFASPTSIEVAFTAAPTPQDTYHLEDENGLELTAPDVTAVVSGSTVTFNHTTGFDLAKSYQIYYNGMRDYITYSEDILSNPALIYTGDDLGLTYTAGTNNIATVKVWSPVASEMNLLLYDAADQYSLLDTFPMTEDAKGVWTGSIDPADVTGVSNIDGYYYQLQVTALGETKIALDPYAKSMAAFYGDDQSGRPANQRDTIGKAAIVDLSSVSAGSVPTVNTGSLGSPEDFIAYEVHIRDFTIKDNPLVTSGNEGTFTGFAEGVDHLTDLGITHAQILPVMNHYKVVETDRDYDAGVEKPNYNWGYDPHSYFTLEGHYSSDATDPYARIAEFRDMVDTLHVEGVGVIMDVVYNHTVGMMIFENVAPGLYHRASGGATPVGDPAIASERPMVRKLIIDSMKSMVNDYGVDGFRFDLMGFMDIDTFTAIRAVPELANVFLYGEAWNFTDITDGMVKGSTLYPHNLNVAMFNDTIRDAVKGSGENGHQTDLGFIQGEGSISKVLAGVLAGIENVVDGTGFLETSPSYDYFAQDPAEALQYLGVHDGFTFWDKINLTVDGTLDERIEAYNQATAMLFTSQGKILIQAGAEFGRTKPLDTNDPEENRAATTPAVNADPDTGATSLHNNTYSSSDFTNYIRWNRKTDTNGFGSGSTLGFSTIYNYYKGLIDMRQNIPEFTLESKSAIESNVKLLLEIEGGSVGPFAPETDFSFMTGQDLTINFINGPTTGRYYLVGELYTSNQNPDPNNTDNYVDFTAGSGSVVLDSADYADFAVDAWGNSGKLDISLVLTPGSWDKPAGAYTGTDNNTIDPARIDADYSVTIDLNIPSHDPGAAELTNDRIAAWELGSDIIVAHNTASTPTTVESTLITVPGDWTVILNNTHVDYLNGVTPPLGYSIAVGEVTIPANTSIVITK